MVLSKFYSTFYLVSFAIVLQTVNGVDPLHHVCSLSRYSSATSGYELAQSNLEKLLASLSESTPPAGFSRYSIGTNSDQIHGLALCKGDVNETDCKTCVEQAGKEIPKLCPSKKSAVIWYDNCMLKYSNKDFFGHVDMKYRYRRCNWSWELVIHSVAKQKLIHKLLKNVEKAPNLYAIEDVKKGVTKRAGSFYGMAQCTRDLSVSKCKRCLRLLYSRYSIMCAQRDGGKIYTGSCFLRYESSPFK
ncbi:hypothetical protein K2173_006160 [Erythroxylum novogranatense]|uniref:Gnk2-homologous domain-containing protein n=1 Tax=Erythroxylum novogranatense TaxID=1862640 RepID=A0AAV8TDX2_9ROSI|nr:hypothetical protein K2173_006160 [Erythroxylum novogranatense]